MLTRLRVSGFKNLTDVDVRFGPFTCIAGPNGVGKSNLFDAIAFLGALAHMPLLEAARSVRAEGSSGDVRSLFTRVGDHVGTEMRFAAEMIIPAEGLDDLGQTAKAGITFVRYSLALEFVPASERQVASIRVVSETLEHIRRGNAKSELPFPHAKAWRDSVVSGRRTSPYISTGPNEQGVSLIQLHADSEGGEGDGRPRPYTPSKLPRTVLSSVNAVEHRTAVLVRREMMAWTQLRLEPSALRSADPLTAVAGIGSDGSHLPATLYALMRRSPQEDVCARVATRVAELVERIDALAVERDERRQLLELVLTDRSGTPHYARSLSDGTLRFLALAVLEQDPTFRPLVCLEEPENGIHPTRIPAMLRLLKDVAVDSQRPVGDDNPLRQVLINTHSPLVVGEVDTDDVLVAELVESRTRGLRAAGVRLSPLEGSWRAKAGAGAVARGRILEILLPASPALRGTRTRVIDTPWVQLQLFGRPVDAAQ